MDMTLPKGLRPYGVSPHITYVRGHCYPKSVGTPLPHTPSVCYKMSFLHVGYL